MISVVLWTPHKAVLRGSRSTWTKLSQGSGTYAHIIKFALASNADEVVQITTTPDKAEAIMSAVRK